MKYNFIAITQHINIIHILQNTNNNYFFYKKEKVGRHGASSRKASGWGEASIVSDMSDMSDLSDNSDKMPVTALASD